MLALLKPVAETLGTKYKTLVPKIKGLYGPPETVEECHRRAIQDSADYADAQMSLAAAFPTKEQLWSYSFQKRTVRGLICEFGVFKATSTNNFAKLTTDTVFGFDSFEGLKEDWKATALTKGSFTLAGKLPKVRRNVTLIKGWFDVTLPIFLDRYNEPFSFVHIDCDTYEATRTVFALCRGRFVPGTVILFDEYFGYRGWRLGEFRAWQELVEQTHIQYEYLGFSGQQVAIVICA